MKTLIALIVSALCLPVLAEENERAATLVRTLSSGSASESRAASEELQRIGAPALAELRKAAASDDAQASATAKEVLDAFWQAPDLVPPDAGRALRDIRRQHDALVERGEAEQAAEIAQKWTALRTRMSDAGTAADPAAAPEVHAVGFRHGLVEGTRAPRAEVEVSKTEAPVILVLSGAERVRWDVHVADGARLRMVVVTGPVSQVVKGVPADVKVVRRIGSESGEFAQAASMEDEGFQDFAKKVEAWTGSPVVSLQGGDTYGGAPVKIGAENPRWSFERVRLGIEDLRSSATEARRARLKTLRFFAAVHVADHGDGIGAADFTPGQVIPGTLKRSPQGISHVALDTELGMIWAVSGRGAFRLDRSCRTMEQVAPGDEDDVPDLDHPCGAAFDTRRRRVAFIASGIFYLFDPARGTWEAPAGLAGHRLSGLSYAADEDAFYALEVPGDGDETSKIVKLSVEGRVLDTVALSEPFPCRAGRPEQVICVPTPDAETGPKWRLVLLGAPLPASATDLALVRHVFVVDPSTGQVELKTLQDARQAGE